MSIPTIHRLGSAFETDRRLDCVPRGQDSGCRKGTGFGCRPITRQIMQKSCGFQSCRALRNREEVRWRWALARHIQR